MIRSISITGPESTGKSELAKHLAERYKTVWVPEYAREYLYNLPRPYGREDLLKIAQGQLKRERALKEVANSYLFCDTDILVIKIWSEFKYGIADSWINRQFKDHRYQLSLLCDIDLPWEEDPLREHPHQRGELFRLYQYHLESRNLPFGIVSGYGEKRLENAMKIIEKAFP